MGCGGGIGGKRAQNHIREGWTVFLKMPTMPAETAEVCLSLRADPQPFNMETGDVVDEASQKTIEDFLVKFNAFIGESKAAAAKAAELEAAAAAAAAAAPAFAEVGGADHKEYGSVKGGVAATEKLVSTGDPDYDAKMQKLWGGPAPKVRSISAHAAALHMHSHHAAAVLV